MPRLINLALALAALTNLVLLPTEWLAEPLLFKQLISLVVVNLLIPASILLIVLCMAGLHRKDQSAMPPVSFGVMLGWLAYFALWILGANIYRSDTILILFLFFAIILVPLILLPLSLVLLRNVITAINSEFTNFRQADSVPGGAAVPALHVAGVSLALIVISALILWFSYTMT